jgi:hypothetical protein
LIADEVGSTAAALSSVEPRNPRFIPAFSLSFLGDPGREMHRF